MRKTFSMLLALFLCFGVLAGCGSNETATESENESTVQNDSVFFKGKIEYKTAEGESVYRVIRPDGDTDVTTVAATVFKAVKETVNVSIKNQTDSNDGTDVYEILVGNTNRPETATVKQYLKDNTGGRYDDYIVCTIGKKIVIYSQSAKGLEAAAQHFITNYLKAEGVDGFVFTKAAEGNFTDITVNGVSIADFKIIRPHFNTSYLTQMQIEQLVETVYQKTGFMLSVEHDEYAKNSDYQIIVGNAVCDGVKSLADTDAYNIRVSGKKVYLNGGSAHATAIAVSEFSKLLNGDVKDQDTNGSYYATVDTYDSATTLRYAWGDDFEGDKLNTQYWEQSNERSANKGENGKTSVRSSNPNDVFVNDGSFHICARQDENYYYGGRIKTQGKMVYKYGYVEMSAVLPHGSDFWVALWACADAADVTNKQLNMYSEIDIVECFGNTSWYAANCHSWPTVYGESAGLEHTSLDDTYGNEKKYSCPDNKRLTETFHTYGMLWTDKAMTFVCDGDAYFTYEFRDGTEDINTFNEEMYLIISMALGFESSSTSINDATPDDWAYTNKYIVDWINIYQKNDGKSYVKLFD